MRKGVAKGWRMRVKWCQVMIIDRRSGDGNRK
jgi:hypothetical protein